MIYLRHFKNPPSLTIAAQVTSAAERPGSIPICAIHGWLDNSGSFRPLMEMHPKWPWVACDLIGHGQSAWRTPDAFYYFHDYLCDLGLWLENTYPNGVHLMGHSLGAAITSLLAGLFPDKVKSLILFDGIGPLVSTCDAFPEQFRLSLKQFQSPRPLRGYESREAMALARQKRHLIELRSTEILAQYGHRINEKGLYEWTFDPKLFGLSPIQLTQEQVIATLTQIQCPVFFLKANQGYPYEPTLLAERIAAIRNIETLHIDGGHHVHMDCYRSVSELIDSFYERHNIRFQ